MSGGDYTKRLPLPRLLRSHPSPLGEGNYSFAGGVGLRGNGKGGHKARPYDG
ncbi:MAG: hypothetical protein OEV06_01590 [Anaerolineae bacterium]|nr:hypothetical protein [Anaerolineae bacterium]